MTDDWLSILRTHQLNVTNPWSDCPLCHDRIGAAERESRRLFRAGAERAAYLRAEQAPRIATLLEHERAVIAARPI